jgi:hypothetical protein
MRQMKPFAIIFVVVVILFAGNSVRAADGASDACALLTQAQASAALGVSLGTGAHPGGDSASAHATCQWSQPGQGSASPKRVMLVILGPMGTMSPADRFESAKRPVQGITKTPISGVGDDACYVESRANTSLYVKKGNSVFQILVFGFPPDQVKTMEKTLAQQAVLRL